MSVGPNQPVDISQIEQARQRINRLTEELAHLSEQELSPAEYYGEFLQRILTILEAPAGAVWVRTPQGNLQLQYQVNMRQVGLDRTDTSRQMHDELLRQAAMKGQPGLFPPHSSTGENGPGNPTDLFILLAPIIYDKQVAGMVEVWHNPMRGPDAMRNFLQFLVRMAGLAAGYTRNHQLRQMVGQQQVWVQLESFARQIHGSLNPTEVSYLVANEGRRLSEADRVSVALRTARRPQVYAISGADVVEKRSNLVQLMRKVFEEVMLWGERLVYSGSKDESLPPAVNRALDLYLAESNSKLLVVMPLKDERESKSSNPPRSALMMECFEPSANAEQMLARLEVIGKHATSSLYNATEYRRIPFRFLWLPLAKVQDGLGGKAKAIMTAIGAGLAALILAMIFIPYPLKMDSKGTLKPKEIANVYAPVPGRIKYINPALKSGDYVQKGTILFRLYDKDLAGQISNYNAEISKNDKLRSLPEKDGNVVERLKAELDYWAKKAELKNLMEITDSNPDAIGEFYIRAPIAGIILTPNFRENLNDRGVKPNEPLLRIGAVNPEAKKRTAKEWEIELKIPQKHVGQVLEAYRSLPADAELEVDLIVESRTTQTFKARLSRKKIASQANVSKEDAASEPEPVVLAWARLTGKDIAADYQVPPELLLTDVEIRTKIRCGDHAMGYSLFYGVWEFIYEKVLWWF